MNPALRRLRQDAHVCEVSQGYLEKLDLNSKRKDRLLEMVAENQHACCWAGEITEAQVTGFGGGPKGQHPVLCDVGRTGS